jgi:hypothetical protein
MQGGDFGSSLMNMLEHQSMIVNARLKQPETSPESSTASNLLKPSKSNVLSRQITLFVDVKGVPFTQKYFDTMTVRINFSNYFHSLLKIFHFTGFLNFLSRLKKLNIHCGIG